MASLTEIQEVYKQYISDENTSYAILINGVWGCGKTYLWKETLIKLFPLKKTIYISLNGITSKEEINKKIFLLFLNTNDNKKIRKIINSSYKVFDFISNAVLQTKISELATDLFNDLNNLKNYILCFDDLERCNLPIEETLSCINNYSEHSGAKVVILSDESKIKEVNSKYFDIKEKLIGYSIDFDNKADNIYNIVLNNITDGTIKDIVNVNKELIIDIINTYNQNNIRTIQFLIKSLIIVINKVENISEKYFKEVILFLSIISFEYKSGKITIRDLNDYRGIDNSSTLFGILNQLNKTESSDSNQKETYAETFAKKYFLRTKYEDLFHFYRSIYRFVITGLLDVDLLKREINERTKLEKSDEEKDIDIFKYGSIFLMSDEECQLFIKKVLDKCQKGGYSMYDYIPIYRALVELSRKEIIEQSEYTINQIMSVGADKASKNTSIYNENIYKSIKNSKDDSKEIESLIKFIGINHINHYINIITDDKNGLIKSIASNDTKQIFDFFNKYSLFEIYKHLDLNNLFALLLNSSNNTFYFTTDAIRKNIQENRNSSLEHKTFIKTITDMLNYLYTQTTNLSRIKGYLIKSLVFDINNP